MAGISPDCSVCNNIYDETERKPLVLLCGHTYCQQCLHSVMSGSSPACPSCRKRIGSPVNELPVNFMLIPSSSGGAASGSMANTKIFCISHQNELDYWCSQCQVLICKRCLVQTHAKHEFTLAEEIFADERILPDLKGQISADLLQVETSIHTLQQLESLAGTIDKLKSSIPMLKKSFLKQQLTLKNLLTLLEEVSSEPSIEQKNLVLKMLKDQNQMQLKEVSVNKALKSFQDQVAQCQIYNLPNGRKDKPIEKYMPDGHPWLITSTELAEKALCTMKETDHQTPRATVISTDESPILCLPELLQYLAGSHTTMELQLMDKAVKSPYNKNWLPLKAEGDESTDFKHCYRLKTLANSLVYFQTLTAALLAVDNVTDDSSGNKVVILVDPATRTYDVYVLTYGKIVKSNMGSWPLPLEIHVIGMNILDWEWEQCILPFLYYIVQPKMSECRVYLPQYLPQYVNSCHNDINKIFRVFADLGKKFSTQHRLYLPTGSVHDIWEPSYRKSSEYHKIPLEFRDF